MVTRTFTGTVITPDGTTLSSGKIILTPVEPLRADESGVLIPSRLELTITDGDVSGSIVAPAHYAVVVMTDRPVLSFIAHVSDDPGDITFAQLYESRHGTVSVDRSVDELIAAAIAAHEAAADPHDQYLTEEAGLGDMLKATYDPDDDGQVERADVADAVDWPDVTNKPTDFPPSVHNHDADYSPIGHNHDSDYAASDHNHDADYSPTGHNHDGDYSPTGHDHDGDYAPLVHSHSNATDLVDGMMSAGDKAKLDGIDEGATDDQTASEILALLKTLVPTMTQAEAEAGTLAADRLITPERLGQAIAALAAGGGGITAETVEGGADVEPAAWATASTAVKLVGGGITETSRHFEPPATAPEDGHVVTLINVSGGVATIKGVTGGDISLAVNRSMDLVRFGSAWYRPDYAA